MTGDHPAGAPPASIAVDWTATTGTSRTILTTHLWTAPPLRRGSPIHDKAFGALRDLNADLARFLPWYSHPHIAVPALTEPTATRTSWDFSRLDPFVEDFVAAAAGRPIVANFATIPAWMFRTPEPVSVPDDPDQIVWDYEQGSELRDPTCAEVADYFYRIASWYIAGGFTDEHGRWHESGHRYRFAYWEVLCEPDLNHRLSPQTYTAIYDAVVERLRPLDPEMKFVGLSLSHVHHEPEYFWSFLDPANHAVGIPVDAISFHFYATAEIVNPFADAGNAPYAHWRDIFFAQAESFLDQVRFIDSIRRRLAPDTAMFVNEVGTFTPDLMNPDPNIPAGYWALSASVQSYLWSRLVELGVDLVGIAEFMGYPSMIPGTSLIDWETGAPNARYHALALLLRHFGPGDTLVSTTTGAHGFPDPRIHARGLRTSDGQHKILVVNKCADPVEVMVPDASGPAPVMEQVATGGPVTVTPDSRGAVTLDAHATGILTF